MPDNTKPEDAVEVIQQDRDAAANYRRRSGITGQDYNRYVNGVYDYSDEVQAFARHRLATSPTPAPVAMQEGEVERDSDGEAMIPVPRGLLAAAAYCARKLRGENSYTYLRLSEAALRSSSPVGEGWKPMSSAPRDKTRILVSFAPPENANQAHLTGRVFETWYEGTTPSGFDLGWAVYPGYGGVPDSWFAGWMDKPAAPVPPAGQREGE